MRIFLTGATGFVGRALAPALEAAGHEVFAATRHPDDYDGPGEPVRTDLEHSDGIPDVLATCDAAYFLVHSLDRGDYAERDRGIAKNFVERAGGLGKVIYLGGLGARGEGSEHLRSRHEVGDLLAASLPTVELRAAMVLGAGSASYELLRQLVALLVDMPGGTVPGPRAMATATQPVGLDEIVTLLVRALDLEPGTYDVGVREPVTFAQLMEAQASASGRRLSIDPVLPLAPELFAPLAALATDQAGLTILALFGSAGTPTVVDETLRVDGDVASALDEVLARLTAD